MLKLLGKLVLSITLLPLTFWLWPETMPVKAFDLWKTSWGIWEWIVVSSPLFAYGVTINAYVAFTTRNDRKLNRNAESIIKGGTLISLYAGIFEEITDRWLFFLLAIPLVKISNWLIFGWAGLGLAELTHNYIAGPIANFTTLGYLEAYIFHESGWALGAAMLTSNAFFRDGHKYQGFRGLVFSWFAGMYFFYIMFQFGLPAAIFIHFLYDFLIFLVHYIDAVIERSQGYV